MLAACPCPCFWHRWFADQREASRYVCGGSAKAVWGNKINPRGSRLWQQVRSLLIKCQLPRWMWFVTLRRPLRTIHHMISKGRLKAVWQTKHFQAGWRFCRSSVCSFRAFVHPSVPHFKTQVFKPPVVFKNWVQLLLGIKLTNIGFNAICQKYTMINTKDLRKNKRPLLELVRD